MTLPPLRHQRKQCTQATTSEGSEGWAKAKLGGEPSPGRVRRALLWRNTLKGVSAEQPLEPLRLY